MALSKIHEFDASQKDECRNAVEQGLRRLRRVLRLREEEITMKVVATALERATKIIFHSVAPYDFMRGNGVLFKKLMCMAVLNAHDLDPGSAVKTVLSMEKIGRQSLRLHVHEGGTLGDVLSQLSDHALSNMQDYKHEELIVLLCAFAKLEFTGGRNLLDHVLPVVLDQIGNLSPKTVAKLGWTLGRYDLSSADIPPTTLRAILRQVKARFKKFSTLDLCSTAWGLARLNCEDAVPLLQAILDTVHSRKEEFTPLAVSRLVAACDLLSYHPGDGTLDLLATLYAKQEAILTLPCLAEGMAGFTNLGYKASKLYAAAARTALGPQKKLPHDPGDVTKFLGVMSQYSGTQYIDQTLDAALWTLGRRHIRASTKWDLDSHKRSELFPAVIHSHVQMDGRRGTNFVWKNQGERLCFEAWRDIQKQRKPHPIIDDVRGVLEGMGHICDVPGLVGDGLFVTDGVVHTGRRSLAIMIVLKSHVFRNNPRRLRGDFVWMRRALGLLGWPVLSIAAAKWGRLETQGEKEEYVAQKLSDVQGTVKALYYREAFWNRMEDIRARAREGGSGDDGAWGHGSVVPQATVEVADVEAVQAQKYDEPEAEEAKIHETTPLEAVLTELCEERESGVLLNQPLYGPKCQEQGALQFRKDYTNGRDCQNHVGDRGQSMVGLNQELDVSVDVDAQRTEQESEQGTTRAESVVS
ncbi:unnamed protein product [Ostreobium quekettii]|uniref:RAP domain-containing protein n=1 Tax=Ostreobium quekettii TaxID=121088 RepID=A0A8S1IMD8_9CHLO|nr:unnamed protein product [Ostreobium quekettii]